MWTKFPEVFQCQFYRKMLYEMDCTERGQTEPLQHLDICKFPLLLNHL